MYDVLAQSIILDTTRRSYDFQIILETGRTAQRQPTVPSIAARYMEHGTPEIKSSVVCCFVLTTRRYRSPWLVWSATVFTFKPVFSSTDLHLKPIVASVIKATSDGIDETKRDLLVICTDNLCHI